MGTMSTTRDHTTRADKRSTIINRPNEQEKQTSVK